MSGAFADAELEAWAEGFSEPSGEFDVAEMRSASAKRARARPKGPEMHEVRDLLPGELGARLYRPLPDARDLIVYFHGGGWTIGSLDSHDRLCRHLAAGSAAAVLAIDYDLTCSHPSMRKKATGWGLDAALVAFFAAQWVPE